VPACVCVRVRVCVVRVCVCLRATTRARCCLLRPAALAARACCDIQCGSVCVALTSALRLMISSDVRHVTLLLV
jgi:hypothetical protein